MRERTRLVVGGIECDGAVGVAGDGLCPSPDHHQPPRHTARQPGRPLRRRCGSDSRPSRRWAHGHRRRRRCRRRDRAAAGPSPIWPGSSCSSRPSRLQHQCLRPDRDQLTSRDRRPAQAIPRFTGEQVTGPEGVQAPLHDSEGSGSRFFESVLDNPPVQQPETEYEHPSWRRHRRDQSRPADRPAAHRAGPAAALPRRLRSAKSALRHRRGRPRRVTDRLEMILPPGGFGWRRCADLGKRNCRLVVIRRSRRSRQGSCRRRT